MSKKSSVSLGPGASSLILIFVVLSLSVLGMLSLMSGRNDLRLSVRSAEVVEQVYQLNDRAEATRAELGELVHRCGENAGAIDDVLSAVKKALPEGVSLEGDTLVWQETDETRTLDCAVIVTFDEGQASTAWLKHDLTSSIGDNIVEEFF